MSRKRKSRRRKKGNGRLLGGQNVRMNPVHPYEFDRMLANSGLVWTPTSEHPRFPLQMVKEQFTGGGFDMVTMKNFFPDGVVYRTIGNIFDTFNFRVDRREVDARFSSMFAYLKCVRSIFGYLTAFKLWNAIFDAAFSDIELLPSHNEPVIALRLLPEGEYTEGWDDEYQNWDLLCLKVLKESVNEAKSAKLALNANAASGNQYMSQLVAGLQKIEMLDASPMNPLAGSFGEAYYEEQPGMYHSENCEIIVEGERVNGYGWGEALEGLVALDVAQEPTFPIDGQNSSHLMNMDPIHRFGYSKPPREFAHTGIDLAAPTGTGLVAIYDGKVKYFKNDWESGGSATGNFVVLNHEFKVGNKTYKFTSEYYHMDTVEKLQIGQELKEGDTIGTVGNTGKSKGSHLHFVMTAAKTNSLGRSTHKIMIDPELVLRKGIIITLMEDYNWQFIEKPAPNLATGGVMLRNISQQNVSYPSTVYGGIAETFETVIEKAEEVIESATQAGAEIIDKGMSYFAPGQPARTALITAYNTQFPGTNAGLWAVTVLDALNAGNKANMNNGEVSAVLKATFAGIDLDETQKAQAFQLALNMYGDFMSKNTNE